MSIITLKDPSKIEIPDDLVIMLGFKKGDKIILEVDEDKNIILKKIKISPLEESFGIWRDVKDGVNYINKIRDEWEER